VIRTAVYFVAHQGPWQHRNRQHPLCRLPAARDLLRRSSWSTALPLSLLLWNLRLIGIPWMRWPGLRAGCWTARLAMVPTHPSSRLSIWGSWRLRPMFLLPSPYSPGVGPHKPSRLATSFPVSPLFDSGRRPMDRKVGTSFVPTPFGASRRAGAAKDGRRPPRSSARKACVLDGSEHRGTSSAVNGGGCGSVSLLCAIVRRAWRAIPRRVAPTGLPGWPLTAAARPRSVLGSLLG